MMFLLRCPNCKNTMKYNSTTTILGDKSKKCVYCPKSFKVRTNIEKKL